MLSCDRGFCFVSHRCFSTFPLRNILNGQRCREARVWEGGGVRDKYLVRVEAVQCEVELVIYSFFGVISSCGGVWSSSVWTVRGTGRCLQGNFGTRSTQEPSKRLPSLQAEKDGEVPLSAVDKPPPPPLHRPSLPPLLLYLPPLFPAPIPAPLPWPLPCSPLRLGTMAHFQRKAGKKRRPVSQNCLFADGIFKSSTS